MEFDVELDHKYRPTYKWLVKQKTLINTSEYKG